MEEMHLEWHAAASLLLVRSYKILHKCLKVDVWRLLHFLENQLQHVKRHSWLPSHHHWEQDQTEGLWTVDISGGQWIRTALIFSTLCLGNFSHMNENAVPLLSSAYTEYFMRPNLIYRGGSNTLRASTRGWWAIFFVLSVCDLKDSSSCCRDHFWHDYPIRTENRILHNCL